MSGKDKVLDAVDKGRPYVDRIAHDDDLHGHVKNAYDSARKIYDELIGERPTRTALALQVARDQDLQKELRKIVDELREAGKRVQGEESHKGRNTSLLLAGIAIGVLFNPATGPETRRWLREKLFGAEQPYEYQSNASSGSSGSSSS
jgi:hypothetical protein